MQLMLNQHGLTKCIGLLKLRGIFFIDYNRGNFEMSIMKSEIKMRSYQRKNGYPAYYYASESEIHNVNFRTAKPAKVQTQFGYYKNGRITSVRFYES